MNKWLVRFGWMALGITGLYGVAALAGVVSGGPLDPPGPPATTPGGIDGRLPIRLEACCPAYISELGSYYLTADLVVNSNDPVIQIDASEVTLDLNGFTVGNWGDEAITVNGDRVTIRNGRVWSSSQGIVGPAADDVTLERLDVLQKEPGTAVNLGSRAAMRDISVLLDAIAAFSTGIQAGPLADISGCSVTSTLGLVGISVGEQSRVRDCTVTGFTAGGGVGIQTGVASRVTNCNIRSVTSGIVAGSGSVVERCTVGVYGTHGINVGDNTKVSDNQVDFNAPAAPSCGIRVGGNNNQVDGNHLVNYALAVNGYGVCIVGSNNSVFRNDFYTLAAAVLDGAPGTNNVGPLKQADDATAGPWANLVN